MASGVRALQSDPSSADGVIPWLLIAIGGGRTLQALALAETWGAEATLCLCMLIAGAIELVGSRRR
jgi:hypothetical protein